MKKMKKTMLVMMSGLLFLTVAVISCKKDSNTATPVPTITDFTPTTAPLGATVTITGTNFTGATAVRFGGTAASYTVLSATSITAIVGTGTTGIVEVVTPGGTASKTGFIFDAGLDPVDGYSSSNEVEAADLISHWSFDGNLSENIHSASPVLFGGTQSFIPGKIGQAVRLSKGWMTYGTEATPASIDNTGFSSSDVLGNGFTLTSWAHLDATDASGFDSLNNFFQLSSPNIPNWPILGLAFRKKGGTNNFDMDFGLTNVDGTGPHVSYGSLFNEPAFQDSLDWVFLAVTYDAGTKTVSYYANNILRATKDLTGIFPDPAASLLMITNNYASIGSFEGAGHTPTSTNPYESSFMSHGINGDVDDIRFFKKTLSTQKLDDLYILGNQGR